MNWAAAAGTGFGLGLVYFGGLWIAVQRLRQQSTKRFAAGWMARLALVAVTFYALLHTGGLEAIFAGLVGLLIARWYLIRTLGRTADGR